jgi:hypothetical protein
LQDAAGKKLCSAFILEVQPDPATGVDLPRRLRLEWPSERLRVDVKLDEIRVNAPVEDHEAMRLITPLGLK